MKKVLFLTLLLVLAGIFLPGIVSEVLRGHRLPQDEVPAPSGPYVNDPNWGNHFNLDDYEKLTRRAIRAFHEPPLLAEGVKAGRLPPVAERLPENPLVMVPWETIGRYGGRLRYTEFTIGYDHYLRHLNEALLLEQKVEPGVATQFKWAEAELRPGVLESWEQSDDARVFTFSIRRGLKWSDGVPVTTEDVRFLFENVVFNKEVMPVPPRWARWGGKPVRLEVLDRYSFRLIFHRSYGLFLPSLGWQRWASLMLPKHYLKQFHKDFTPLEEMAPLMKRYGYAAEDWGRFYLSIGGAGMGGAGAFVPEHFPPVGTYPTLDPWLHVRQPSPACYILERNPYFYKIDPEGNQLPYIDTLSRTFVSDIQIENLKILSGETDLQFQFIRLEDFPMFKRGEDRGNYRVILLPAGQDYMLIYPMNLHTADPVVRPILGDVRFRRALSMALNREEIKQAIFLGIGRAAQLAPLPGSPWYRKEFETAYARYDPEAAGRLLDEMGLRWDEDHSFRLTPDGKPFTLRIDYYDVSPASGPGAELAKAYWEDIGIQTRVQQVAGLFGQLRGANEVQVTVWWANGATPVDHSFIGGFSMTRPWHQWYMTEGEKGEEPPEWAKAVCANVDLLYESPNPEVRRRAGTEIFETLSRHLWTIGTVADVPIPFVYSKDLRNIAVAEQRGLYTITVADSAEQWYFESEAYPAANRGASARADGETLRSLGMCTAKDAGSIWWPFTPVASHGALWRRSGRK